MKLRDLMTRTNIVIAVAVVAATLVVAAYFALRRPPRVAMERYAPATTLAFIEIDNLADLIDGLTQTRAWRELAPALGLSSQIRQIGRAADLISRTGLGPDEAVVAGRAQFAVALTAIEAETGATDQGPYIHFKPRFAFIVETHAGAQTAARLVGERASILAGRIYGAEMKEEVEDYLDARLLIFRGVEPDRELVAASSGSVALIANHRDAIKQCLDAINQRGATLAEDDTLKQMRPALGERGPVFAYLTEAGITKLVEFGPAIFASRFTTDPDSISAFANLVGHISKQAAAGLLYSSEFAEGGVTEKYLTVLRPQVAEAIAQPLKPATTASFESLSLIPANVEDFTILNVKEAGQLPARLLGQLTPRLDLVAGLALRELVSNIQRQLGLEPADASAQAVGDEVTLVKFHEAEPMAMLVRVKERAQVLPALARYLGEGNSSIATEQYGGLEIVRSSNEDGRAASFVRGYLVLGTRDQIITIINAQASGRSVATDERLKQVFKARPSNASIISYRPAVEEAGEMMLAIAKLTRVSDGSPEALEQEEAQAALDRLPPSVSFTEFRDYGIYTQAHSAIGSFNLISSLAGGQE
jgi:hypothetical protein